MRILPIGAVLLASWPSMVYALPGALQTRSSSSPCVSIQQGHVNGYVDENYGLDLFLGIPFAKAPVEDLRYAKPVPIEQNPDSEIDATKYGNICMQAGGSAAYNMSEDCLNLNVIRPKGTSAWAELPVLTWIYGGAFQAGATPFYNGSELVQRSVRTGKPIVFVAINYRVNSFGFIGGSEVAHSDSATPNAGLYDQRLGLEWIQNNIAAFGGNPKKVTIFGQSAGAMSVALQTFAYDGCTQDLFSAAIMQSGGVAPGPLLTTTHPTVEQTYASLAAGVGCTPTSDTESTLACLRKADAGELLNVTSAITADAFDANPIPGFQAFLPLVDGELITDYPSVNFPKGKLADIPIITGNMLDEGPLFAPQNLNNTNDFETWLRDGAIIYNTSYTETAIEKVLEAYPDVPERGSPYYDAETNTSAASPNGSSRFYAPSDSNQYKRAASFFGDFVFAAQRRAYLSGATREGRKNRHKTWSYLFSQNDKYPNGTGSSLGAYHGADNKYIFILPDGRQKDPVIAEKYPLAFISFAYYHDPTVLTSLNWPAYVDNHQLLQFKGDNITVIPDTFRQEAIHSLINKKASAVFGF